MNREDKEITRVAVLYYVNNVSQGNIAKKFNISRSKVSRMIKEARDKKIVEFKIRNASYQPIGIESKLEKQFKLKEVLIYHDSDMLGYDKDLIFQNIGLLGSDYIKRTLKHNINITLTWGKTLYHVIKSINLQKEYKINIFATMGGVGLQNSNYQSSNLVKMLGERTSGNYYQLYLPLIVKNKEIKDSLIEASIIKTILGDITKVDYFISSVGTIFRNTGMYLLGGFKSEDIKILNTCGVVGEIGLNFYNKEGEFVKTGLEDRLINININEVRRVKSKVLIAFGNEKIEAILGCLKTGVIDVFITDTITAESLI